MKTVASTSNNVAHLSEHIPVSIARGNLKPVAIFIRRFRHRLSPCRIRICRRTARKAVVYSTKVICCNHSTLCNITRQPRRNGAGPQWEQHHSRSHEQFLLAGNQARGWTIPPHSRGYGMFVVRILRGALKLRYLVLGGAIGGGVSLSKVSRKSSCPLLYNVQIAIVHVQKYEDWKEGLPDMKWLEDALPQGERWSQFSQNLIEMGSVVKNAIDIGEFLLRRAYNLCLISHFKLP